MPDDIKDLPDGGATLPVTDIGPGFPGTAGEPCTADTQCQPPTNGACIEEAIDAGYVGGACTAECTGALSDDTWCGTMGVCNPAYAGSNATGPVIRWFCDRACGTDPNTGASLGTCRSGYVCDDPTSQFGSCIPRCNNPGARCGTSKPTCNTSTGLCQ